MSKVLVIGGGPAGCFAAIAAAEQGHQVVLLERNEKIGKKLFITGKGRCNLTNACDTEELFSNIPRNSKFLYSAIYSYDNFRVMDFFEQNGTPVKVERGNRVFPVSDHSSDVIAALKRSLDAHKVKIMYHTAVEKLMVSENCVHGVITAEGKKMMYAITWNEDGTKMLQVGIEPKRLLNEIKQNNISNVVAGMPVYKAMEIMVADADTQVIEGSTDSSKLGKKLEDVGISADHVSADGATVTQIRMDGKHCRCMMHQNDNYIVIVTVEDSFYQQGGMIAIFIVGAYLVLASCCITYMFSKVMKERLEKEKLIYTSNTDELTRCLNRHAYENDMKKLNLSEEWVYISVDLNGLKRANDSYGHMAGDELICAAADCMRDSFHEYGKVYRIGGDEFAVIITENPNQVEELIHSFDSNVANWHGKFVDSMTVSYGWVFSTERNWGSAYEISKAADARMYQSKERYYKESGADRR